VHDPQAVPAAPPRVAIYARVSSHDHQASLDRQAERLLSYCAAKGYQVSTVVKEIASGVNDSRPKLLALLEDQAITLIVVEHQERLTRFGFRYLDTLLKGQGRALAVVNEAGNETEDLMTDLTSIIYSFCAGLYGQRRAKRQTEAIVQQLAAGQGRARMQRVEQHVIDTADPRFAGIAAAAFAAKNLSNAALYAIRQTSLFEGRDLSNNAVYHRMKHTDASRAFASRALRLDVRSVNPARGAGGRVKRTNLALVG
jgi:putative resolvase